MKLLSAFTHFKKPSNMKKWLFNPFEMVAGWMSLFIGTAIVFITAVIAFYSNTHLDGVIDLHLADSVSFLSCLLEGFIDWLSMTVFIYIGGLLFSKSAIRIIDVLGTQGMARFPFLIASVFSFFLFGNNVIHYFEYKLLKTGQPVELSATDIILFGTGTLINIVMAIWMILLMYRSYSISCNVKGNKGILSFIGCLIFAEILSKVLISIFYSLKA